MMRAVFPALTVLLGVLVTAVPWGLPAEATFIPPLVVVMMVFCWRATPEAVLPPAACMALGLLADVTTGGPLGFWALMFLFASSAGARLRKFNTGRATGALWFAWMPVAAGLSGFGWLLASLYFFRWVDWTPIVFGAVASIAIFPSVFLLIRSLNQGTPRGIAYGGRT